MSTKRTLWVLGLLALILGGGWWFTAPDRGWAPAHGAAAPLRADLVERGRYLARAGDCVACHTAPGGGDFAGGRKVPTPFGALYSSNLTPDMQTGLGQWNEDEFWGAMHFGISKDGRRLYPAFPYTNYTKVTREDSDALFAYLRSLPAVQQAPRGNELRFPYNLQLALRGWRALFFRPDQAKPRERGEYLVTGLGHCDACHTPRNALGALDGAASYAGGPIPMMGWDAPALAQPMSDAQTLEMAQLLKTGSSDQGVMSGPMAEVVFHSTQYLSDADITAMVGYLRALPPRTAAQPDALGVQEPKRLEMMRSGALVYRDHCAQCHGDQGEGKPDQYPALAGNALVTAPSAANAITEVLMGGFGPSTAAVPMPYGMPSYAHELSKQQVAAVLTYIRGSWGNQASAVSPVAVERH